MAKNIILTYKRASQKLYIINRYIKGAVTLIIPIVKVDHPVSLTNFKQISSYNFLLKMASKVLVQRIRPRQKIIHFSIIRRAKKGIFFSKLISRKLGIELIGVFRD